jgi:hypothetical protein
MSSVMQKVQAFSAGLRSAGYYNIADAFKVLFVTFGSIVAVVFASLIISIIQFQSRLSEARTQNSSITFESIQLIAEYQGNISKLYTSMREGSEKLLPLRADYLDRVNRTTQQVISLCNALDPSKFDDCYARITGLINSNNSQLDATISDFKLANPDTKRAAFVQTSTEDLKNVVTNGQLYELQSNYFKLLKLVQSQCASLTLYVSDRLAATSLLAVSPELRGTITIQCDLGGISGGGFDQVQNITPAAPNPQQQQDVRQPEHTKNETQGVNRLLLQELVFYYKFYDGLTAIFGELLRPLILAPPEFVTIILVISTGVLGSFLFHTYSMFSVGAAGTFPPFSAIFLRATLGVMCALVLFILMRTGFVAVTEGQHRDAATVISPFVIAFMSVAAGLLADPALERIKYVGLSVINSGGRRLDASSAQGSKPRQKASNHAPAQAGPK